MKTRQMLLDALFLTLGCVMTAVGVSCFAAPNNIAAGGFTGLATVISHFTGFPIGTAILLMNIPVFIAGFLCFGRGFIVRSAVATVLLSAAIDIAARFSDYRGDTLLAALFGGLLSGVGLALVFLRGATTGGVDVIAKLINRRFMFLSVGKIMLLIDGAVVLIAAVGYRSIENALYAVVLIFVQSKALDGLIYGADRGRVLLVASEHNGQIGERIMRELERGVTLLDASGGYTHRDRQLLLCAVRSFEAAAVHRIISECDSRAFVLTLEAGEIKGEGFRPLK